MAPPTPNPPPRNLNVKRFAEARAPELESLHSVISKRLNHNFKIRRDKRRRTTDYRCSKKKIRKTSDSGLVVKVKVPRRVRRRLELQSNPDEGFVRSGDGTKRLRTHLWHAKRFTMVKRWGFYLPLGVHGRGRGSRAVLNWSKLGALVHDASYYHPIQLEGPEDSILALLRMVLLPSPSSSSEGTSCAVKNGDCYVNAMLYHVGAPCSQFIAPVIYMWRPLLHGDSCVNGEEYLVSSGPCFDGRQDCSSSSRQLWIWIHAAASEEGFCALKTACEKQMLESGGSVSCFSVEGRIAKLDVVGSKAAQILQKIIDPISDQSGHSLSMSAYLTPCTSSRLHKSLAHHHLAQLPIHAILSLTVSDPRDLPSKGSNTILDDATRLECDLQKKDTQPDSLLSSPSAKREDDIVTQWSNPEADGFFLADSRNLWSSNQKLNPPIPENSLYTDRHQRRLKQFYLDSTNHETPVPEVREDFSRSCPILLLKHANSGHTGWSIILPLNWVKAFWTTLISLGAHAIGLRERRWIACDSGLPCFPNDFPDCKAYSSFMAAEATAFESSAELRPPPVRPSRVPIPPPWDCIESACNQLIKNEDIRVSDVQPHTDTDSATSMSATGMQNPNPSSSYQSGTSFNGYIQRFSDKLIAYGNMHCITAKYRFSLVRVLIHAYKEGAFEEGAVVCAPTITDLSCWESRYKEDNELQIPQSLVKSYFTQQDSGKWELQLPENCSMPESYRWPIGFITTGFVRGSKKPTAVSFCEARLLSQLREQQSSQAMENEPRREIRVLVRNLRSAAYRRAFVTVLLEEKEEDTEFI